MSSVTARAQAGAKLLLDARRFSQPLVGLPHELQPRSAIEAYQIQDAVLAELGPPGGWKVGARSPDAEPTCSPLPAELILRSPQVFPTGAFSRNGVEAELAFTLARDLPPRARGYDEAELRAAIASVHAAIEVVDSRFVDMSTTDAASLLADFQSNGALVVGAGVPLRGSFPSTDQTVHLIVDGAEQQTPGRNPAGNLMRLMAWLADHVAMRRGGLRRGDIITTGSWTGMRFLPAGARVDVFTLGAQARKLCGGIVNAEGVVDAPVLASEAVVPGEYEVVFHIGAYFRGRVAKDDRPFLDTVPFRFALPSTRRYLLPVRVAPSAFAIASP